MTINIVNDRGFTVARLKIEEGTIVEKQTLGCFVKDVDGNDDGSLDYKLELISSPEAIENFSNETLLDEIKSRMCQ